MITPQSANWTTLAQRAGRGIQLLAYIEGIPDVLCTHEPADARTKTYAVDFDGTNDYIDCGTNTALTNLADWTVMGWIKPDTLSNGSVYTICGAWDNTGSQGFRIALSVAGGVGSIQVKFTGGAAGGYTLAGATVAVNTWTFFAVTLGGLNSTVLRGMIGTTELTRQDIAVSRATRNAFTGGQAFQIAHAQGASYFNGRIGYLSAYSRGMTMEEIRKLKYRRIVKTWGDDDSTGLWDKLVAQWDLERGSGTLAQNSKLAGTHDGTLTNGPTWASDACYTCVYRPCLSAEASTEQSIDPLGTRTNVSATTLKVLDTADWFTAKLAELDMALPGKRVDLFLGFFGCLEAEYQRVFMGKLSSFTYEGRAYTLRVADGLLDAKKRVQLGRTVLQDSITNAVGQQMTVPVNSYWADPDVNFTFVKIDDEVIAMDADSGNTAAKFNLEASARAQYSTTAAAHSAGARINEIWKPESVLGSDELVLFLLLSEAGYAASDAYDTAAEISYTDATTRVVRGRGVGLSPSDVASAEIAAVSELATDTEIFIDEDIDDLKDLIERELLRPRGCYFFVKADGRISVGSHAIPSASVYDLDPTRTFGYEWDVSYEDLCNYLAISYDWTPKAEEFQGQTFYTDAAAVKKYGLRKREYSFKAVTAGFTPTTILNALATLIFDRFLEPYRTVVVTCGFYEMLLEIGDCVSFTNINMPNVSTGTRGVIEKLWQIIGRQVDFQTGRVRLTLADVSDL